jgi:hypothetical protein
MWGILEMKEAAMKIETVITLSSSDRARLSHLSNAWNLVGGNRHGAKHEAQSRRRDELGPAALEAKLFGKIATSQFTMSDVRQAVAIIQKRRDALHASCADEVFTDAKLQQVWADGVKANSDHAVRLANQFMNDLKDDLLELAA